jgi:hypothetical protein
VGTSTGAEEMKQRVFTYKTPVVRSEHRKELWEQGQKLKKLSNKYSPNEVRKK